MGSGTRLIAAIFCGLVVAIAADVVLSATTSDEITVGASLVLFTVTMLTFMWAFR